MRYHPCAASQQLTAQHAAFGLCSVQSNAPQLGLLTHRAHLRQQDVVRGEHMVAARGVGLQAEDGAEDGE